MNVNSCTSDCMNNVVPKEKLHEVFKRVLCELKDCLVNTYGPMGSYTAILKGDDYRTTSMEYSKDGKKVLSHYLYSNPIEACIKSEIEEIARYVEKIVGDGTTSAILLAYLVYIRLIKILEDDPSILPRVLVNTFQNVVYDIKKRIMEKKQEVTLDDIYDISLISLNGNTRVANAIKQIYREYGNDVNISVDISNDTRDKVKVYDGLSIEEGFSDQCYVNSSKGVCNIRNANVYYFRDPIDTPETMMWMEQIIFDNVFAHANDRRFVPTVIIARNISTDAGVITRLAEYMYKIESTEGFDTKPPVVIITNLAGTDIDTAADIAKLCGCKTIQKYIDPDIQKRDQENGNAPTMETIHNFAGSAEAVIADLSKTKFINPKDMVDNDGKGYKGLLTFLRSEIKKQEEENGDPLDIGRLKKRLHSLEANLVEYYVGGITISDRDSLRDLVEDAVKNCYSAAQHGYGRGANVEGLLAAQELLDEDWHDDNSLYHRIATDIYGAYKESLEILYRTITSNDEEIKQMMDRTMTEKQPINIADLVDYMHNAPNFTSALDSTMDENALTNHRVIGSIRTDVEILDAIFKIISIMVTSNQCLLQSTSLNRY